ncbi:MAG: (Fe-S)-binding protein [Firmicutes bacterium HGW-Firmicutes-19]|nr:MAG: (Fe-S)-binding protein [Firmicutes bacterium HGW-Firmicutes-19]
MGHITSRNHYDKLVERLNRFPQGAPPSETLYKLLSVLFSKEEAQFVSVLPVQAFTAQIASKRAKKPMEECEALLDGLASRAILLDWVKDGVRYYILPPPMAGWIEFSMMRIREDIDQHSLGQLLYQYMNVEEDFVRDLFFGSDTKIVRAFANEEALRSSMSKDNIMEILDHERATHVINSSQHIGIGVCYCRHKMEHVGKDCDAPKEICMTFGNVADSLIRAGYARKVEKKECLDLLEVAYQHNLVQIGENSQNSVSFICNCCGCCCEALLAAKKFGTSATIATTSFLPQVNHDKCTACGVCVDVCPMDALSFVDGRLILDEDMCLGCGVCVRNCAFEALTLIEKKTRMITPVNGAHRVVLMAVDKGMLGDLMFDNSSLASHRMMAGVVNAILALPPAKQLLANQQIRSKYLARMIEKL